MQRLRLQLPFIWAIDGAKVYRHCHRALDLSAADSVHSLVTFAPALSIKPPNYFRVFCTSSHVVWGAADVLVWGACTFA